MNKYLSAVQHGIASLILFMAPMLLMSNAPWLNLTIGGVLTAIYHVVLSYKS